MVIYLRHPIHGTKVAISQVEAQQDEALGWTRYEVVPAVPVPSEPVVIDQVPEPLPPGPAKVIKRKRG